MSTPIKDGGPAFPLPMFTRQADGMPMSPQEYGLGGMTLRDWFAGQALAGAVGFSPSNPFRKYDQPEDVAAACYRFADAMLAAREVQK
jgi:hypothetical protein